MLSPLLNRWMFDHRGRADMALPLRIRFTPESGHRPVVLECPLSANSGHQPASFDYFIDDGQLCRL